MNSFTLCLYLTIVDIRFKNKFNSSGKYEQSIDINSSNKIVSISGYEVALVLLTLLSEKA